MAMTKKQTPEKLCEWCGTLFSRKRVGKKQELECVSNYMRRKFCSISCSVSKQHATEPPTVAASRKRAQKSNIGICEACTSTREVVVHHVNGNPMDNSPSNLQTLCAPCHSFWHALHRRIGRKPEKRMPHLVEAECSRATEMPSRRRSPPNSSKPQE